MSLHFNKIVKNQWYGYPQEWFPSVSSTIGDRYPERSIFMIVIALTSGALHAVIVCCDANDHRTAIIPRGPLLPPHAQALEPPPEARRRRRRLPYPHVRRLDLRHVDRPTTTGTTRL